jgi:hypothetical protein
MSTRELKELYLEAEKYVRVFEPSSLETEKRLNEQQKDIEKLKRIIAKLTSPNGNVDISPDIRLTGVDD